MLLKVPIRPRRQKVHKRKGGNFMEVFCHSFSILQGFFAKDCVFQNREENESGSKARPVASSQSGLFRLHSEIPPGIEVAFLPASHFPAFLNWAAFLSLENHIATNVCIINRTLQGVRGRVYSVLNRTTLGVTFVSKYLSMIVWERCSPVTTRSPAAVCFTAWPTA